MQVPQVRERLSARTASGIREVAQRSGLKRLAAAVQLVPGHHHKALARFHPLSPAQASAQDVRTTMQPYVRSDQESELEAQGKSLELLLGQEAHLLKETIH